MATEPRIHPLQPWMTRTKTSYQALSDQITAHNAQATPKYLDHIVMGRMEPGWHLCEMLEAITGIDARLIKSWGYRNSKHAASG